MVIGIQFPRWCCVQTVEVSEVTKSWLLVLHPLPTCVEHERDKNALEPPLKKARDCVDSQSCDEDSDVPQVVAH